jgi:hypothetical protein
MSETSPLEAETRHETTTFEHFGRDWSVPTKRHLSHVKRMRDEMRSGYSDVNLMVSEVMLGDEQFGDLLDIDPDEDALNEFVEALSKAMGLGSSGNSKPSSASS